MSETKSTFEILSAIDCNDKTEKKNGLTYLSWAWAWGIVKSYFPDANYELIFFDGKPYLHDETLGYLVLTRVTINGETIGMQLPVMDGANRAQKSHTYTYDVAEWVSGRRTGKMIQKNVEAATMFDINTTIMRCLTKNLAMFGLGHYIYAGEDLPVAVNTTEEAPKETKKVEKKPTKEDLDLQTAILDCEKCQTNDELKNLWNSYKGYQSDKRFIAAVNKRKGELE